MDPEAFSSYSQQLFAVIHTMIPISLYARKKVFALPYQ
jgi:hypothetical protein